MNRDKFLQEWRGCEWAAPCDQAAKLCALGDKVRLEENGARLGWFPAEHPADHDDCLIPLEDLDSFVDMGAPAAQDRELLFAASRAKAADGSEDG